MMSCTTPLVMGHSNVYSYRDRGRHWHYHKCILIQTANYVLESVATLKVRLGSVGENTTLSKRDQQT